MTARRKQQGINRAINAFQLDTFPGRLAAPGTYRYVVESMIKEAGGLREPPALANLPLLPTGPWNKKLTCGHIVRDNCGGCGQYQTP